NIWLSALLTNLTSHWARISTWRPLDISWYVLGPRPPHPISAPPYVSLVDACFTAAWRRSGATAKNPTDEAAVWMNVRRAILVMNPSTNPTFTIAPHASCVTNTGRRELFQARLFFAGIRHTKSYEHADFCHGTPANGE